jgi:hypothetical protein
VTRAVVSLLVLSCGACGSDAVLDLLPPDGGADASACTTDAGCPCGLTLCGGACVDIQNDALDCNGCGSGCAHNQYCAAGACQCLPGMTLCGASCFDLRSDPDHCGACNATPCASGDKCENGACATGACTAPLTACDVTGRSACVALDAGEPYCGACGSVCAPGQICAGGTCQTYAPATPCTTCPCPECGGDACCPGIGSQTVPICVAGGVCQP